MNLKYLLLCFLGSICSISAQSTCNTPDRTIGTCISLRKCPALLTLLEVRPLPATTTEYLRRANCGFDGIDPKVCCAIGNSETTLGGSNNNNNYNNNNNNNNNNILQPTSEGSYQSNLLPDVENCGLFNADRIIGGEVAELDDFPWMALIEYQRPNGRGFYCGGVLINPRYILTAAHCLKGKDLPKNWNLVSVRLGEYNRETNPDCTKWANFETCAPEAFNVPVTERIAHESYDPNDASQLHDIALLRLSRNVEYSEYARPICLPTSATLVNEAFEGSNMTVAGWGTTENRTESQIKLKVQVPVQSNTQCADVYKGLVNFGAGQMCAGGFKGKDSCRGDSGGALMTVESYEGESNWYAAGIVSFGPTPCGLDGWPGVYTRVTHYIPWIISKLRP